MIASAVLDRLRQPRTDDWIDVAATATDYSATITGLDNDKTYEARVFASNSAGAGPFKSAGSATTKENTDPSGLVITIEQGALDREPLIPQLAP